MKREPIHHESFTVHSIASTFLLKQLRLGHYVSQATKFSSSCTYLSLIGDITSSPGRMYSTTPGAQLVFTFHITTGVACGRKTHNPLGLPQIGVLAGYISTTGASINHVPPHPLPLRPAASDRYHGTRPVGSPTPGATPLKAPRPGRPLMWPPVSQRRHAAVTNVSPRTRSPMKHLRPPSPALPSVQASVTELCADIGAVHPKTCGKQLAFEAV